MRAHVSKLYLHNFIVIWARNRRDLKQYWFQRLLLLSSSLSSLYNLRYYYFDGSYVTRYPIEDWRFTSFLQLLFRNRSRRTMEYLRAACLHTLMPAAWRENLRTFSGRRKYYKRSVGLRCAHYIAVRHSVIASNHNEYNIIYARNNIISYYYYFYAYRRGPTGTRRPKKSAFRGVPKTHAQAMLAVIV